MKNEAHINPPQSQRRYPTYCWRWITGGHETSVLIFLFSSTELKKTWHDILIHERICQALGRGRQSHRSSRTHVSYNKSKVEIIVFIYFVVVATVVVAVVVFLVPFLNLNPWSGADWGQHVILSAQDPCTHACTLVHRAGNQVWTWPPPSAHSITPPLFQVEVPRCATKPQENDGFQLPTLRQTSCRSTVQIRKQMLHNLDPFIEILLCTQHKHEAEAK